MNLRDLKYLVALSKYQHFGKAATACFVSQPALSMQIKKLEETLGIKLLERTNKSVLLTETGIIIAERAKQILDQVEEIHTVAQSAKDPYCGELKLGIFPTLAPYLLPHIIPQISKKFPKLSFYLIEEQTDLLLKKLNSGQIHAAILALPVLEKNLNSFPLFNEEFMLAMPNSHELARRKTIRQQDLHQQPLLLLEEGHCMRAQALDLCYKMNAHEAQDFRATSLETLRHMVAAGVGITLIPQLACHDSNHITYLPFSAPKPTRTIGLVSRASSPKKILLEEISQYMRKVLSKNRSVKIN